MAQPNKEADYLIPKEENPPQDMQHPSAQRKAVTARSVLLCVLLLPINAYWVVQMEVVATPPIPPRSPSSSTPSSFSSA